MCLEHVPNMCIGLSGSLEVVDQPLHFSYHWPAPSGDLTV